MEIIHKQSTAYYLAIPMIDSATPANFKTGLSPTDAAYYKDGASAWASLAIADTFSEIGSTGVYEIDIASGEFSTHDQVLIKVTGSGAADTFVLFRLYVNGLDDHSIHSAADVWAVGTRELSGTIGDFDALDTAMDAAHGAGSWATAVGFSTHAAADVWTVGTRELSGTIGDFDALDTALDAAHGAGSWASAVGFSTHAAADVWSVGTRELSGTIGDFDALDTALDAAHGAGSWLTGGGGSITDILNVQPLVPFAIDLADTATVRVGLGLTNMLDDLPSTAEIDPGTITIDRKAIGGTSWTNIVNAAACSEVTGLIYYDEVFDSGAGYAAGDTIRVTFKAQKITVAANDYEITGTDGWIFHTYIREAMYSGSVSGSNQVDLTIEEGDTTPIPDVNISIMNSDSTVLLATGASDSNGEASFALDDGTYKVLLRRIGWTFVVPETLVVDETPETATYNGTEVSVGAPPSPDLCRMHEYCVDQEGAALAAPGPTNYAAIIGRPYDDGTGAYEIKQVTGTYNSVSGLLYWDIVRGSTVLIKIEESGIHKKYLVPDAGSARLGDLTPL